MTSISLHRSQSHSTILRTNQHDDTMSRVCSMPFKRVTSVTYPPLPGSDAPKIIPYLAPDAPEFEEDEEQEVIVRGYLTHSSRWSAMCIGWHPSPSRGIWKDDTLRIELEGVFLAKFLLRLIHHRAASAGHIQIPACVGQSWLYIWQVPRIIQCNGRQASGKW